MQLGSPDAKGFSDQFVARVRQTVSEKLGLQQAGHSGRNYRGFPEHPEYGHFEDAHWAKTPDDEKQLTPAKRRRLDAGLERLSACHARRADARILWEAERLTVRSVGL